MALPNSPLAAVSMASAAASLRTPGSPHPLQPRARHRRRHRGGGRRRLPRTPLPGEFASQSPPPYPPGRAPTPPLCRRTPPRRPRSTPSISCHFCLRNPRACPLLDVTDAGDLTPRILAPCGRPAAPTSPSIGAAARQSSLPSRRPTPALDRRHGRLSASLSASRLGRPASKGCGLGCERATSRQGLALCPCTLTDVPNAAVADCSAGASSSPHLNALLDQ